MNRNPRLDLPMVVAFSLATVASCFLMGWRVAQYEYERLTRAS